MTTTKNEAINNTPTWSRAPHPNGNFNYCKGAPLAAGPESQIADRDLSAKNQPRRERLADEIGFGEGRAEGRGLTRRDGDMD